ncbi:hypothetical protein RF11_09642 [Thelohanellus kitauei]|uniref:Uncharacterized protein n=1 Tax=Thelohanellus kitauei TaxID=669202 RepID=A0A0C2J7G0_THEKT|nr:hypothetical protein RF11_09642 [Thelohanellus kitauei]
MEGEILINITTLNQTLIFKETDIRHDVWEIRDDRYLLISFLTDIAIFDVSVIYNTNETTADVEVAEVFGLLSILDSKETIVFEIYRSYVWSKLEAYRYKNSLVEFKNSTLYPKYRCIAYIRTLLVEFLNVDIMKVLSEKDKRRLAQYA